MKTLKFQGYVSNIQLAQLDREELTFTQLRFYKSTDLHYTFGDYPEHHCKEVSITLEVKNIE